MLFQNLKATIGFELERALAQMQIQQHIFPSNEKSKCTYINSRCRTH